MEHDLIPEYTQTIIEKFGKAIIRRSIMSLRNGDKIIKTAINKCKMKKCAVEIGTYLGATTGFIALDFEKVLTFDIAEGQREEIKYLGMSRVDVWKYVGVNDKISLYLNNKDILKTIDFDFAIIDGNPDEVVKDFELCKKCGCVLFHDVCDRRHEIKKLVESLPSNEVLYYCNDNSDSDIFALWVKNGR